MPLFTLYPRAPRRNVARMENRYILHYAPDNASLIVRLALYELGQPFRTRLVDRQAQGQRTPSYLALNPHGLIPVLETPQGPLYETAAILLWLSETHEALAPPPGDADRGHFLKWLFFTSNTLHSSMRLLFHPEQVIGPDPGHQAALRDGLKVALKSHLQKLDTLAGDTPPWLGGRNLSLLDIYLPVCLRWLALYPQGETGWFSLSDTPSLARLAQRLETRQSTQRAIAAEGLGAHPFTRPRLPTPPEGSAT